jgi:hypothetical protein
MSTPDDIEHFLVACNPKIQTTTVREFGTDYDAAQDAYQEAERQAWGHEARRGVAQFRFSGDDQAHALQLLWRGA